MHAADLRQRFLDYFARHGHRVVRSSALVPENDPTLFFTNAGMVQFKDVFVGKDVRDYSRATTVQKCLRVSGKHNDLENVGHTPRHHTFFEMLGNFSFGDYFKPDAIRFAWDLLTNELQIDPARLWITVYEKDDEARDLWQQIARVPDARIQALGEADNFWAMGDTGPCGPCTEIHYDHGPSVSDDPRGPAGGDRRYVEIWNLVFMQYERAADGSLSPLPRPSIDTGAGLERVAAVTQGVYSNYDTDLFTPIVRRAAELARVELGRDAEVDTALRVIADHARATAFLVADGVMPSNEERGYVLRRIMRRGVRTMERVGAWR
jgi:alanyl-tRNA synthetase